MGEFSRTTTISQKWPSEMQTAHSAIRPIGTFRGRLEQPDAMARRPGRKSAGRKRISCVVCAYNEEDRIRNILDAVDGHPALS